MIRAGVLSDTHLSTVTRDFSDLAGRAFADCDIIFHAGDLTHHSLLRVFEGKTVYGVHGNMCDYATMQQLPNHLKVTIEGHVIGLCHGAGPRHNIEDRLWSMFADTDCIIFGHTHNPVCEHHGSVLFLNPGSFQCSPAYGSPASYAILEITRQSLHAQLHTISL